MKPVHSRGSLLACITHLLLKVRTPPARSRNRLKTGLQTQPGAHEWLSRASTHAWVLLPLLVATHGACAQTNQLRPWPDYQVIMWVGDSIHKQPAKWPLFLQRLRELGVTAGMVYGDGDPKRWVDAKFPYYVENIVNRGLCLKWSSKVTDWDKFVTRWKDSRDEASLVRDYCLDDPQWRADARAAMQRVARRHKDFHPLLYDIRDELSTTVSANPFDYDFNPIALKSFREWLKTQYPTLDALNRQWETQFATWDEVKPFTTDQIKHRMATGEALPRGRPDWQAVQRLKFDPRTAAKEPTRWNFSPWCDFRTYMDISLARALDDCRQAARAIDPRTPVGIEGTQMPHAFGGYDLWRLSQVLDWVEPYDIANSREILGSFMPGKTFVVTLFEKEANPALRRLWHLLLLGDRGCIIWWSEDCFDWKSDDLALTPKAKALAPVLKEMASPLARLFLRAEREYDPIAIHYSQPSVQVAWLLESTVDGSTWLRRFSSYESAHNHQAKVRNSWLKIFQDLGYTPRFVSSEQIERGELTTAGTKALALPSSHAISDPEIAAITSAQTGPAKLRVLANGDPGLFDARGKIRARPEDVPFQQNWRTAVDSPGSLHKVPRSIDPAAYARNRLQAAPMLSLGEWAATNLPLPRPVSVPLETRTRIHRFRLGNARLLAFERGIDYHMSEDLKQAGGNEALEKAVEVEAKLAQAAHVYDLRAQKYLGQTAAFKFTLDPWRPSLFALLPEKVAEERIVEHLSAPAPKR